MNIYREIKPQTVYIILHTLGIHMLCSLLKHDIYMYIGLGVRSELSVEKEFKCLYMCSCLRRKQSLFDNTLHYLSMSVHSGKH